MKETAHTGTRVLTSTQKSLQSSKERKASQNSKPDYKMWLIPCPFHRNRRIRTPTYSYPRHHFPCILSQLWLLCMRVRCSNRGIPSASHKHYRALFLILQIGSGAKVLKPWYGCGVSETCTLTNVYTKFSDGKIDWRSTNTRGVFGNSGVEAFAGPKRAERMRVSCECNVGDTIAALGQYVEYTVSRLLNGDCWNAISKQSRCIG